MPTLRCLHMTRRAHDILFLFLKKSAQRGAQRHDDRRDILIDTCFLLLGAAMRGRLCAPAAAALRATFSMSLSCPYYFGHRRLQGCGRTPYHAPRHYRPVASPRAGGAYFSAKAAHAAPVALDGQRFSFTPRPRPPPIPAIAAFQYHYHGQYEALSYAECVTQRFALSGARRSHAAAD